MLPARPLAALLREGGVASLETAGPLETPVSGLTHDSRRAGPGRVFTAYPGVTRDLHDFLPDAFARGASAALVERPLAALRSELDLPPEAALVRVADARLARAQLAAALHGHPSRDLIVVGVTGTDGKTTTATLLHAILGAAGRRVGLVSTVAARIGAEELDTGLHVTTPEPEDLQAYLARMRDEGAEIAVLEATSHGLAQHRLGAVAFDVAVLTNVTHEALEYHGSFEAYRAAKGMLFEALSATPGRPGVQKTAVLNAADPSAAHYARIPARLRLFYALEGEAVVAPAADSAPDFLAREIEATPGGLRFVADTPRGPVELASPLVGAYNAANILAAMAASHALGAGPDAWRAGVAAVGGIPGRMERIDEGQTFLAIVDFAHTPHALEQALAAGRALAAPAGRVLVVFGCAGLRDPGKRAAMGEIAGRDADLSVITAEDPRTEDLDAILAQIAGGLRAAGAAELEAAHAPPGAADAREDGPAFLRVPHRGRAIERACALASPGDVVLVCGKGHEQSLCFGTTEHPWDDRLALRAALRGAPQPNPLPL